MVEEIAQKKAKRKKILEERLRSSGTAVLGVGIPLLILMILTATIGMKNFTVRENTYVLPTIILGVVTFFVFLAFIVVANKGINVLRMLRANEKLEATEDGRRLLELRDYKQIYEGLLLDEEQETLKNE